MLPSSRRLRASEVRVIIATGRSIRGEYLSAKYRLASGPFRSAIVVSKKLAKTAVMRNRLRRWTYNALTQQPFPKGIEVVIFIQKKPTIAPVSALVRDLTHLCSKLSS